MPKTNPTPAYNGDTVVDYTPSWRSLVDIYAQAYANGSTAAQSELHRMADSADKLNEIVRLLNNTDCAMDRLLLLQLETIIRN